MYRHDKKTEKGKNPTNKPNKPKEFTKVYLHTCLYAKVAFLKMFHSGEGFRKVTVSVIVLTGYGYVWTEAVDVRKRVAFDTCAGAGVGPRLALAYNMCH